MTTWKPHRQARITRTLPNGNPVFLSRIGHEQYFCDVNGVPVTTMRMAVPSKSGAGSIRAWVSTCVVLGKKVKETNPIMVNSLQKIWDIVSSQNKG